MISPQLNHSENLLLNKGIMLFEFKGKNANGEPMFAFLLMDKDDLRSLQKDLKEMPEVAYSDYGIVTHAGTGISTEKDQLIAEAKALEIIQLQVI